MDALHWNLFSLVQFSLLQFTSIMIMIIIIFIASSAIKTTDSMSTTQCCYYYYYCYYYSVQDQLYHVLQSSLAFLKSAPQLVANLSLDQRGDFKRNSLASPSLKASETGADGNGNESSSCFSLCSLGNNWKWNQKWNLGQMKRRASERATEHIATQPYIKGNRERESEFNLCL